MENVKKNDATLFLKLHIVLFSKLEKKRVTIFCVYENDFNIQMFMYMFYKLNIWNCQYSTILTLKNGNFLWFNLKSVKIWLPEKSSIVFYL